jgi:hypothetical protein
MVAGFLGTGGLIVGVVSGNWLGLGAMVWPLLIALYYAIPLSDDERRGR